MNILIIGNGAREHSICWAIKKSKKCKKVFCIPGNAGIREIATCKIIDLSNKKELLNFCTREGIDLVIIGPEQYLENGLSDYLNSKNIKVFGPTKKAAKLETSKSFAKRFLSKNKINTAKYKEFRSYDSAKKFLATVTFPIVLKADGLAVGKGVLICNTKVDGEKGIKLLMKTKKFGKAGEKIIIEEFLEGFEISYFAFFDKQNFIKLGYALDHKKAYDNDKGPNTGGMGCFLPSKKVTKKIEAEIFNKILIPTAKGLIKENLIYRGILFFGLMITNNGPYVIEYNVRFGDPECQILLRNLKTDLLEIIESNVNDKLSTVKIENYNDSVVCIVLASKGYPGKFKKNQIIKNISKAQKIKGVEIFHAGTSFKDGKVLSSGGRVLSITSKAKTIKVAREKAYKAVSQISWPGGFYRNDIGLKNT